MNISNFWVKSHNLVMISTFFKQTYRVIIHGDMPIAIVEMSSRSKKVGYIRMSNDRIHFESLMFYIYKCKQKILIIT